MKAKICTWCGKTATHKTSRGVHVCSLCNGNPALTKWKKVSRYSRIMVDDKGNAALFVKPAAEGGSDAKP